MFEVGAEAHYEGKVVVGEAPLWEEEEVLERAAIVFRDGVDVVIFQGHDVGVVSAVGRRVAGGG